MASWTLILGQLFYLGDGYSGYCRDSIGSVVLSVLWSKIISSAGRAPVHSVKVKGEVSFPFQESQ